jgi:hypothetical protein
LKEYNSKTYLTNTGIEKLLPQLTLRNSILGNIPMSLKRNFCSRQCNQFSETKRNSIKGLLSVIESLIKTQKTAFGGQKTVK